MRAGGQSIDAATALSTIATPRFVVVAYPVECPGREAIRAQTIMVADTNGQSPRSLREARGPEIGTLVAGFDATDAALAVENDANLAIPGQIVIAYDEPCGDAGARKAFPIQAKAAASRRESQDRRPPGSPSHRAARRFTCRCILTSRANRRVRSLPAAMEYWLQPRSPRSGSFGPRHRPSTGRPSCRFRRSRLHSLARVNATTSPDLMLGVVGIAGLRSDRSPR